MNYSAYPALKHFFKRPIGTLESLGRMLKTAPNDLEAIAARASSLYRVAYRQPKSDGTYRELVDARRPLKSIQGRILALILRQVHYPTYLQGGIRDKESPRGQAANARIHVGKRTLITEDIENFFPSVTAEMVCGIYKDFFHFPPAVAHCLTRLTTKNGSLPQGAKTSPLLANLVFWREEHTLVQELSLRGISYSRLVDDITCSSDRDLSFREISWLIRKLHAMGSRCGLRLKRKKQTIVRRNEPMIATKLIVNKRVSLPQKVRSKTRALVHSYISRLDQQAEWAPDRDFHEVSGKISYVNQHHKPEGAAMRAKLKAAVDLKKGK